MSQRLRKRNFSSEEDLDDSSWIDNDIDDDNNMHNKNIWKLDRDPLIKLILKDFPKINKERLENCIENIDETIISQYCGVIPSDEKWKIGLSGKKISDLEPELKRLRKQQRDEEPTLDKIISLPVSDKEKIETIEKFDILQNLEPYTEEYRIKRRELICKISDIPSEEEKRLLKLTTSISTDRLRRCILDMDLSDEMKARILTRYHYFLTLDQSTSEYSQVQAWLEWAISLPWNRSITLPVSTTSQIAKFLYNVRGNLDKKLFGMESIKNSLITHLYSRITGNSQTILALKGTRGSGKTSIVRAYAEATTLPFEMIPLGGSADATLFRGSSSVWVGSSPSIIVQSLRNLRCNNGILLFDELDKVTGENASAVQKCLIHLTDRSQNMDYKDDFLVGLSINVSKIDMIFTFNDEECINPMLRDRLDIVTVPDYSLDERCNIVTKYILPRLISESSLKPDSIIIDHNTCKYILSKVEAMGLRPVEKLLRQLVRKIALVATIGDPKIIDINLKRIKLPITITKSIFDKFT